MRSGKTEEKRNNSLEGNHFSEGDVRGLVYAKNKLVKNLEKRLAKAYTFEECYTSLTEGFKEQDDGELIEAFNEQVSVKELVLGRGAYFFALRDEFKRKGIDCLAIGDKDSVYAKNRIELQ